VVSPRIIKFRALWAFILFFAIWSVLSYGGFVDSIFLPTPHKVISAAIYLFQQRDFLSDIGISTMRVVIGFAVAASLAVPLAVAMATWEKVDHVIRPFAGFTRYLPVSAFIPLLILWLGIGFSQKIAIIFIGVFFHLTILAADDCLRVPREILDTAKVQGATKLQLARKVIFPCSLPAIFDDMRLMLGAAWTYLVVAELVAANSGIGNMMIEAQRFLKTDRVIAGIIVVGIIGLLSDIAFRLFGRLIMPWTRVG